MIVSAGARAGTGITKIPYVIHYYDYLKEITVITEAKKNALLRLGEGQFLE